MCGRFVLTTAAEVVAELFDLAETPKLTPSLNICPTQTIAAIVQTGASLKRELQWFRWGLIPSWAKDEKIGARMFNARSETVAEKPSFRSAFKRKRCIIPAEGFYEWKKVGTRKQPYLIKRTDGDLLALAGLWEHWQSPDSTEIQSCTIITTTPNELLAPFHDRMPVILDREDFSSWLDPENNHPDGLQPYLRSISSESLSVETVDSDRFKRPVR